MARVGIRELKQNASAVVADAVAGEMITITDRGRPVAQIGPISRGRLAGLVEAGLARGPRRSLVDLPPARRTNLGRDALSREVVAGRDDERY